MKLQRILVAAAALGVLWLAWHTYGAPGLAVAASALVMWLLLHFTRLMYVLKRAADRPVGYVGSAVMLNAKLKPKCNLMYALMLTRALGEQLSPKDQQPEIFRWTDPGGSSVTCEFLDGKLVKWTLYRPPATADASAPVASPSAH
ncbi:glycerate kinase [Ramlibacter rhizophilus]|uniref:Glycerate kinase n=1 Tax=Ramlibacter rhizophilus TaxID=1781167 RepID=A0A4Z0BFC6_9BURK|nr:glycerate kinase [Ramlibacter rhizophilus]TFY98055.1 glycerate kinase [Ramlibacter rhizophilus]